MAWTSVRTWVTGEVVTAALLNTHLRDQLQEVWHDVDYTEFTSPVTISATTEAGATTIVTAVPFTADGTSPVVVRFFSPRIAPANQSGGALNFALYEGSSSIGRIGRVEGVFNQNDFTGVMERRFTPTSGSKTYSIRAYQENGNGSVHAGVGGFGNLMPGYIWILQRGG
jgi:hypothetical protein